MNNGSISHVLQMRTNSRNVTGVTDCTIFSTHAKHTHTHKRNQVVLTSKASYNSVLVSLLHGLQEESFLRIHPVAVLDGLQGNGHLAADLSGRGSLGECGVYGVANHLGGEDRQQHQLLMAAGCGQTIRQGAVYRKSLAAPQTRMSTEHVTLCKHSMWVADPRPLTGWSMLAVKLKLRVSTVS